ncbi:MAG: PAC2 family protein [Actinomycetia bacterium]|nr:PAC2 family protein [Actinomycetes bacterium]MCP4961849.1 PAC2 family protein [Actinomycetes bacterium]
MDHVIWRERPDLVNPLLVLAFDGWNDAGDAATTAVDYLISRYDHHTLATIDPEHFFDFGSARPLIQLDDERGRVLEWPTIEFGWLTLDDGTDIVTLRGPEPRLRWRTLCEQIAAVARELGVERVISLGALLAEVHHTSAISVMGTSADDELVTRFNLRRPSYTGPTGIVGVIHTVLAEVGIPAMSLWASVPTYVPNATSPKAAHALLTELVETLGLHLEANDLSRAASTYERQIDDLLEADEDLAEYARQILLASVDDDESHPDDILPDLDDVDGDGLIEDLEQFLRDQG